MKTATTIPSSGTYSIPVPNNGNINFATSGTIQVFSPGLGVQTIAYTGLNKVTNNYAFTGCSLGSGTLPVGSTITQSFAPVTVTLAHADSLDTWASVTATGSVPSISEPTVQGDREQSLHARQPLFHRGGLVRLRDHGHRDRFNASTPASDFLATIDWGDGSPSPRSA